ncbi:MAG: hypothetical protein CML04_11495 [Pseudozobellia sp.]|nr:hypothetical protein [Pseudozobellia sp.]MBG50376.1 hypothetical protein [Pseudozobellia sp.]
MSKIFKLLKDLYLKFSNSGAEYARIKGAKVGENCRILTYGLGSEPWLIEIGNNVTVTSGVRLLTHDGSAWLFNDHKGRRYSYRKIIIGNNVFVGSRAILMPGVRVGDNVIIGAGSIVTKSIPSGCIVGGNPARIIGDYEAYKQKALESFVSEQDLDKTKNYKDRIDQFVDLEVREYLQKT